MFQEGKKIRIKSGFDACFWLRKHKPRKAEDTGCCFVFSDHIMFCVDKKMRGEAAVNYSPRL